MNLQEGFVVYELKKLPNNLGQIDATSPIVLKEILVDSPFGRVPMPAFVTLEEAEGYVNTQLVARTVTILKVYATNH